MHKTAKISPTPCRLGVLLTDRFSNLCLAHALEPFRAANGFLGRAAYAWRLLSFSGDPVTSSSGVRILPDSGLSDRESGDYLFVLPSYGARALAGPGSTRALRAAAGRFTALAGLDMGAWLLAHAGLLDGRAATVHFDEFDAFQMRFPAVDARRERWIIDGDRLSAAGAAASSELALQIIERAHGPSLTLEIAGLFLQRPVGDRAQSEPGASRRGGDPRVAAALELMATSIETPVDIPTLARRVGCSPRSLNARFEKAFSAGPARLYRRLRLAHGRRLLESTELSVMEIGLRCGYEDASAFSRAFRAEFGRAPTALRG